MSQLNVNTITTLSGTDITIPTGKKLVVTDSGGLSVPGTVVQILHSIINNPSSTQTTSTAYVGLNSSAQVQITPKFAGSKFYLTFGGAIAHYNVGSNYGPVYNFGRSVNGGAYAMVDTTGPIAGIYKNDQTTGHWEDHVMNFSFIDSPSYTLGQYITYQAFGKRSNSGSDTWLNHHGGLGNQAGSPSLIQIVMEIAQ